MRHFKSSPVRLSAIRTEESIDVNDCGRSGTAPAQHCSRTKASIGVNERTSTVALQVLVVQHAAPMLEGFVGRDDTSGDVVDAAIDDMEDHIRRIGTVREVAHFIDDEDSRMRLKVSSTLKPRTRRGMSHAANKRRNSRHRSTRI
jgi:hypothetical protein